MSFILFSIKLYLIFSKELTQTQTLSSLASMSHQSLTVRHQPLVLPAFEGTFQNSDQASDMGFNQSWVFEENSVSQPHVEDSSLTVCQAYAAVNQISVIEGNLVSNSLNCFSGFSLISFSASFYHFSLRDKYLTECISQPLAQKDDAASDQSLIFLCNSVSTVSSHELG